MSAPRVVGPTDAGYPERLLDDHGHTQEELARRVGKSRVAVTNALRLLRLPESVRAMLGDQHALSAEQRVILFDIRLPRVALAAMVPCFSRSRESRMAWCTSSGISAEVRRMSSSSESWSAFIVRRLSGQGR